MKGPTQILEGTSARFSATVADIGGAGVDPRAVLWTASGGLPQQRGTAVTFTFPTAGSYTIAVAAIDRAGNTSPSSSIGATFVGAMPDRDRDGSVESQD